MIEPLVSVIVPTKNSSQFLDECLLSIKNQTYSNIELIVVDNFSTDNTETIARKYTENFFQIGPERCTQRNHGALKATGEYIVFIDSDMRLSSRVIESCTEAMKNNNFKGVIIPEESFGEGFWAQCKKLERSFYVGVDAVEAARFFRLSDFKSVNGYNELLVSGEDWDLSDRIELLGAYTRISDYIYHNEGRISLYKTLQKKYYYAQKAGAYLTQTNTITTAIKRRQGVLGRYILFLKQPFKLFRNPLLGLGMLFMKTYEFGAGAFGILNNSIYHRQKGTKILLLGTHGQNNIGDELLLEAFLFQLKRIDNSVFYVNSHCPKQTAVDFNVTTFHTLKDKKRLVKYIFCSNYILFAGGSIIKEMYRDYGRSTYSVMNMLSLLIGFSKKIARKKIILSNIGIGPISTARGFKQAGFIIKNSDVISVRDSISKYYGEKAHPDAKIMIVPDAVFSLDRNYFGLAQGEMRKISNVAEINTITFNLCRNISKPSCWGQFIDEMLTTFVMIYNINPNVKIIGLPMQVGYYSDDAETLKFFKKKLTETVPKINFVITSPQSSKEVAEIINNSDLLIAERLHCAILATIINTPFISLEYDIKVKSYLIDIDLEKNGIDISENFSAKDVFKKIETVAVDYYLQKLRLHSISEAKNMLVNKYFVELRNAILSKKYNEK